MSVRSSQPVAGTGLLLAHDVQHSGQPLKPGSPPKYILRSDLFYVSMSGHGIVDELEGFAPEVGEFEPIWATEDDCVSELCLV